jgi:O-antigen biosynthesis protein
MPILMESKIDLVQKPKTLRVAFICTTVSGVSYYRMAAFAWAMRKWPRVETVVWPYSAKTTIQNPWQVDMLETPWIRQQIDNFCDKADVVVWQGLDFPHSLELFEEMKARHQKPFIVEMDDYIADVPLGNEAAEQFRPGSMRFKVVRQQIRLADHLVVSTPYLADMYRDWNSSIHVIPNSIDLKEWKNIPRKRGDRIRIGWIGGGTHGPDLEMVHPAIEQVLQKYLSVWFYCIHGAPEIYKKMPKVYWTRKWANINIYPRYLASYKFDIGIAPLLDNNFNRGKSNLRWLEYSAMRTPSVCSPLPDFSRVIKHGENGFIANSTEEWVDALSNLIEDLDARRQVGENAYKTVKQDFNVPKTARKYLQLLKEVAQ